MKFKTLSIESIKNLQRNLSSLFGVSGYEEEVSSFIFSEIEKNALADKIGLTN
ncbi:MAG: hypothetical protein ACFFB0_12635 [Promethearchaeota archaeon]